MAVVTIEQLRDYLHEGGASEASLTSAITAGESVVAAWIGAPTLTRRERSQRWYMPPDRLKPLIELEDGPLSELVQVTLDGRVLDDVTPSYWILSRRNGFPGEVVEATWWAGWDDSNVPEPIRQAVLAAAAAAYKQPIYGGSWQTYNASWISPDARLLLQPYRRPGL